MAPLAPEVAPSSWQIGGSKSYCAPAPPSSDRPLDMPLQSPNGGKIFLPTSPPVDPCAFGLCSGSATATNHAPRACTLTNCWSKAVVTAPATPATNPSLVSTGSMRPSHVVLISHAIPCSTGSMHSSHVVLINHTTKFFPLTYLSERSTASPHAPRAHPRPPPAPRPSATSFLHFFAPHVKYPATGLTWP